MQPRLALNSKQSSCLNLPGTETISELLPTCQGLGVLKVPSFRSSTWLLDSWEVKTIRVSTKG